MVKNGFMFRNNEGSELGFAANLRDFKKMLAAVGLDSIAFHSARGDFANWLEYMGKPGQAKKIRTIKGSDEKTRKKLIAAMSPAKSVKPAKKKTPKPTKKAKTAKKPKSAKKK